MKTNKWISVKDKLPYLEEDVLLFDNWKSSDGKEERQDCRIGYLKEFTTRKSTDGVTLTCEWGGTEFAFNITHWMPLPKPPKE